MSVGRLGELQMSGRCGWVGWESCRCLVGVGRLVESWICRCCEWSRLEITVRLNPDVFMNQRR